MPQITLSGVSVSFGARTLLDAVNLTLSAGARVALVGPNGSGKTTLMRIMADLMRPDSGAVVRERDTRVSYVPQSGVVHAGVPLAEEIEKAFAHGKLILDEMRELEERLGALTQGSPDAEQLLQRHHDLHERIQASGYWGRAEAISRVLGGLGFGREDLGKAASDFSAGWQMRIALAKAILESPDILLLDEPTNYLDLEARTWLEEFLGGFPGGVLVVSHDRYFLDVTVRSVAEIYSARVSLYTGNYSRYELARQAELSSILERYRVQQEEIARVEAFIRRFRYNASKARLVQSRITYLAKLTPIEMPPVAKTLRFSFPPPPPSGRMLLTAHDILKSYGGKRVFGGVEVQLERGEKLAVVGHNGAGKSTLLRILCGRENPDGGELSLGTGVVAASFSQESADAWVSERQVIEEVEAVAPTSLIPELRTMLGAFLFRGDDVFKPVSVLSGGEKSRLALLLLLLKPSNLLFLDEPTNHLDLASKDMLLEALSSFPAAVVFVSHDRHFLDKLATAVLEIRDGRSRFFPGGYEYYQRRLCQEQAASHQEAAGGEAAGPRERAAAVEEAPSASLLERQEDKRLKAALRSLEKREGEVLASLEALEARSRALEEEMARPESYSDGLRMRDLTKAHHAARSEHEGLMRSWEKLCVEISQAKERIEGFRSGKASR
jgi:ATP-binding cassette subfamily F protein 3